MSDSLCLFKTREEEEEETGCSTSYFPRALCFLSFFFFPLVIPVHTRTTTTTRACCIILFFALCRKRTKGRVAAGLAGPDENIPISHSHHGVIFFFFQTPEFDCEFLGESAVGK